MPMVSRQNHLHVVLNTYVFISLLFFSFNASASDLISVYSSITVNNKSIVRAISKSETCPLIHIDGQALKMNKRVGPIDSSLASDRPAFFPESVCEFILPDNTAIVRVEDQVIPKRNLSPQKILLLGDTGCRMKAPNEFQACKNESAWPLKKIAFSAANEHPDLVIHVGDYHYRESKCEIPACEESPFGYGFDTWNADLFAPLDALLKTAPWVFVRGNHESCSRAGQGWFRYLDVREFKIERSCSTKNSSASVLSAPYAIPLGGDLQLIVVDSSGTPEKKSPDTEHLIQEFEVQFKQVAEIAKSVPQNWLVLHHPILGYSQSTIKNVDTGNTTLLQSLKNNHYTNFFPNNIQLTIQGHIHTFELTSFKNSAPLSLITGYAGSRLEPVFTDLSLQDFELADGVKIAETIASQNFGYTILEKNENGWILKQKDINGQTKLTCLLILNAMPGKFTCSPTSTH